jgi:hypothetical protein
MSISLLGQASGGFTQSNSALRILHVGVRNTVGQLTADSFTQTNPPVITTAGTKSTASGFTAGVLGVLSGSIAFARNDEGEYFHGGPTDANVGGAGVTAKPNQKPLGCFINTAVGLAFTNQPGVASNRGPYVSAQGTYGNSLYETQYLTGADVGDPLAYSIGDELFASVNGYLTNSLEDGDLHDVQHGSGPNDGAKWTIGILTVAGDTSSDELVYDQRI